MRNILFTLLFVAMPLLVMADAVEIDGIYYNLISKSNIAEVTKNPQNYSGNIVIPSEVTFEGEHYTVTSISEKAFYQSKGLKSITIPGSITQIGNDAFSYCDNMEAVYISDLRSWCKISFISYWSNPLILAHHLFIGTIEIRNLVVPDEISILKKYVFAGGNSFTSIEIPNHVNYIEDYAFAGCSSITSITIPESITSLCGFREMEGLVNVNIPNSVTSIEPAAFAFCYSLSTLSLPNSITSIGNSAFQACTNLSSINIPENLTTIADYLFCYCTSLESIMIPNNIKEIGYRAFDECKSLKTVVLGSGLKKIYGLAFSNCKELKDVYCYPETVPYTNVSAFDNSYIEYATLHIPYGTSELYGQSSPWNQFGTIEEMAQTKFQLTYMVDDEVYKTYTVKEGETIPVERDPVKEGYSFSGWNGLPTIMPSHDVTVTGSFTINKYKLTYLLDWQEIKTTEVVYGTAITPEPYPTKDGYLFTGWSCLPEIMPAHDVTTYGAFYQSGKFMYGFKWEVEEMNSNGAPQITLAVGEKYRIQYSYSSSDMPDDIFYLTQTGNWVTYERKYLQGLGNTDVVVDCPEIFSISPSGVITAHKEGLAALKPTGYIQSGGGHERCYINVVTNYEEKEPNNDLANANELKFAPTTFYLYNPTDQDFFKVNAKAGDKITFKVKGSHNPHLGYKWNTFAPSGFSLGSGTLLINEATGERDIIIDNDLTNNLGNGYYYLQIYYDQSMSGYVTDLLTVQAFINDEPVTNKIFFNLKYKIDENDYKSYLLEEGESIIPEPLPEKEGYTFSGWNQLPVLMPAHDVTVTGSFAVNQYKLTYIVDGQVYKIIEVDYGTAINPEPAPTKEGHTFSGWSEIPATMPAHDVTVTGAFTVNKYQLTYIVDGEEYKTLTLDYGTPIIPEPEPTKEGNSFSGWSEIPATMPAHTVIVTGTFTINKYKLTYMLNDEVYKSQELEFGAVITPEPAPEKEGHTFSGWSEIPATMPAHDVTVTGFFFVNKYILTYILDGKEYKTMEMEYGKAITPEPDPEKEGYTFSGWSEIPETMPAHIVIITGSFAVNSYTLTYMIDEEVYKQVVYEYGAAITPEPQPEGDYVSFEWVGVPETMPAHDVTVTAVYETGIAEIMMMAQQGQVRIYSPNGKKLNKLQKGLNIVVMQDVTTRKVVVK